MRLLDAARVNLSLSLDAGLTNTPARHVAPVMVIHADGGAPNALSRTPVAALQLRAAVN